MAITLQDALQRTIEHREIFHDEMLSLMRRIMSGEVSPVMIAALTVGLRVKKETIGEIAAAAQVMREFATKVDAGDPRHLLDIVGTGGDASHTFNISTACDVRRRGGRRARRQARQPVGVVEVRQRRRARGARRQYPADARAGRRLHRANRRRLHVRAHPPWRDEARGTGSQGARRADDLQHPRAADESGRRGKSPDRRVPSRSRRHPRPRAAAAGQQARDRRLRQGRHGRGVARRRDDGRRAQGRRGDRVRDPSGGLRPAHEIEPRPQGDRMRASRRKWCSRRCRASKARRARSSC